MIITGDKEFYKGVSKINYEGKESDNPFAYKYYNPDQLVMGKTMREHFKFAIAYWHSFCGREQIHLALELKNFHGINQMIHCKEHVIKQMQHLN